MSDLTQVIKQSFEQYSGAVLQSRALVDVRDCLKPSARQIFYCLYTDKFVHKNPYKKTLKGIGSAMRMYIHGDSSCEGIIMRAGQPFAMRYPLIEVEGSYGNLMESGNWAAPRYTASRLSDISNCLFADIDKDTISDWRDNYDDTEQYPSVLSTKGFYNIVNGTSGIGIGMGSCVPQYNLREVNEALIKLLWNPDIDFEEIYCVPDFATGAFLINPDEVKESMRTGRGKACKLRSAIDYDEKERCFVVSEIPYSVYTNTICGQLEDILNGTDNPGIERFNDLTGSTPLIKIYLSKTANPAKVLKYLFKNTSLQYHYSINFTMLENGRFPRVFTWKEALQAHIDHEITVYRQGFIYDLNKIKHRLHIVEGLLKAISIIDDVIALIKGAADTANALRGLQQQFGFTEAQAKAILDIKLSRLAHLEISKLEKERDNLTCEYDRITNILQHEDLLKKEIEKGLQEVSKKYGDERRTQVLNIKVDENDEDAEPIEKKSLVTYLTNKGNLYATEVISFATQKRGGRGTKIKLPNGEYVVDSIAKMNDSNILAFTTAGKVYTTRLSNLELNTVINPSELFRLDFDRDEHITNIVAFDKTDSNEYIIFTTKQGMIKKSNLKDYKIKRGKGVLALKMREGDELVNISFTTNDDLCILTKFGNSVKINTEKINEIGRVALGVVGIKLNDDDYVVNAHLVPKDTTEICSITSTGMIKRTSISEYPENNRATKGSLMQKLKDGDTMADFVALNGKEREVMVVSNKGAIKFSINDIPQCGRATLGNMSKKLALGESVQNLMKILG